jgi:hypothetical protein
MRAMMLTGLVLLLDCVSAPAQSPLAERIFSVKDGTVRMSYAVQEGICGDGETFIRDRRRGENSYITFDDVGSRYGKGRWRDWPCEPGPARIAITKTDGEVTRVRLYVGGDWSSRGSDVVDLGEVSAPAAAKALIAVAARDQHADKALFAAMIADSAVVWPDLLALAKNESVPHQTRKSAVFWLSQAAGDAATKGLSDLAEDESENREVRDQAVFALSQLPKDQGIPVLIRLAKSNKDPKVRRKALFWLGQSDDPRVLKLFEEILTGK